MMNYKDIKLKSEQNFDLNIFNFLIWIYFKYYIIVVQKITFVFPDYLKKNYTQQILHFYNLELFHLVETKSY